MTELEPENNFLHIVVPNFCPLSTLCLFSAPYISLFLFVFFTLRYTHMFICYTYIFS